MTNKKRRAFLKSTAAWAAALGLSGAKGAANATNESQGRPPLDDRMRRAMEQDARAVTELYSTKPVRVVHGPREYVVPANYFSPKGKSNKDIFDTEAAGYFGFVLFLPEYGGYTQDNWRDPFDRRRVQVIEVKNVSIELRQRPNKAAYGEQHAQFENVKRGIEAEPFLHIYDLVGYRPKNSRVDAVWTGTRSNGEFFFFRSHLAPGDPSRGVNTWPFCNVRYYSEQEDLYVSYRYSNDHLAKWREIDDAIWAKLRSWRVK